MKIAVCYFGVLRTFKNTVDSHTILFDSLKQNGIELDIYIHTWYGSLVSLRGNNSQKYVNDVNDVFIGNPYKYSIDNQDDFINSLHFPDFFYKEIFDTYGESRTTEWFPDLILFHLCSLESQRRVIELVHSEQKEYDKIVMMRPDIIFNGAVPLDMFSDLTPKRVFITSHDNGEGYNDQFAIFNSADIEPYKNRISFAKEYRKNIGRIVGEKYLKYILDTHGFQVVGVEIPFKILRE